MEKKYRLLENDTITVNGRTLHRIEALRDFANVKKGEKGGYIESKFNLSHIGNCWVCDDARVCDNARVSDNSCVSGTARVFDNALVCTNARISGNAWVCDDALVCDNARISGNAWVCDDALVCDNAQISDGMITNVRQK